MGSMLYSPPQFGQSGGGSGGIPGSDPSNLVQLAMQVKAFKMQEAAQKKTDAQQKAQLLMSNPQLLMMTDPKDLEKTLKEGYGLNFNEKQPPNPQDATQTAPPKAPQGSGGSSDPSALGPASVNPNQISQLANTTGGNKAGAQSASPPSASAAGKAPGGGVTQTSFGPTADAMAAKASETLQAKYGALAPLYGSAIGQVQIESLKAKSMAEIEDLRSKVAETGDIRAQARLAMLGGQKIDDATMRSWVVAGGGDEKAFGQAMDVALGNETGADKAKRFDTTLKNLLGTPEIMGKLENPADVAKLASSIVYGGTLPQNITMKPMSMTELKAEADYENNLMTNQGMPYGIAHLVARARTLGVSPTDSLPPAMQTFVLGEQFKQPVASRDSASKATVASADMLKAQAEKEKADDAHNHITVTLSQKKYDLLNDRLKTMIEAQKAGHPFPKEVQDGLMQEVAHEVGYSTKQVKSWYEYLTGGSHQEYTAEPDTDLARKAVGGSVKVMVDERKRSAKPGRDRSNTPQ